MSENTKRTEGDSAIRLENRQRLSVTGVREVKSFDDTVVHAVTEQGTLTVRGKDLHITVFATETGDLAVEGRVDALGYSTDREHGGFFGRLLK